MKVWKAVAGGLCLVWGSGPLKADALETMTAGVAKKLPALPGSLGREYDELHPYYVKYCTTTKLSPMPGKGKAGGIPGHAVFYLKGVCPDKSVGPSGLNLCPDDRDYTDPDLGLGLSTDRFLKNANFFVIPTRKLFLSADLSVGETFDDAVKERMIKQVEEEKLFQDFEFHEDAFPKDLPEAEREHYMAGISLGTDFGVGMGRNLYCINVPVPRPVMGLIVGYLNELNCSYKKSEGIPYRGLVKTDNDYHWDGLWDNCTHTPINAMAAVGIMEPRKTNLPFFQQLAQLAIPSHTFLDINDALNKPEIDVDAIYEHPMRRKMFREFEWIPLQDGVISEFIQMYQPNTVFEEDDRMYVAPDFARNLGKEIRDLTRDLRFSYHGKGKLGYVPHMFHMYKRYRNALAGVLKKEASRAFKAHQESADKVMIAVLQSTLTNFKAKQGRQEPKSKEWKDLQREIEHLEAEFLPRQKSLDYVEFVEKFKKFLQRKMFLLEVRIANFIEYSR
ncbi:MAG: hypothetical protein HYW48_02715 [Deltaproteobacteria bacterium]|nr:hypothetical protein [Deltaproteobacteria bacterium]